MVWPPSGRTCVRSATEQRMRCGMAESEGTYVVLLHAAGGTSLLANKARHLDDSLLGPVCPPAWRHAAVLRQLLERFAGFQNERQLDVAASSQGCLRSAAAPLKQAAGMARELRAVNMCARISAQQPVENLRFSSRKVCRMGFERQFSAFVLGSLAAGKTVPPLAQDWGSNSPAKWPDFRDPPPLSSLSTSPSSFRLVEGPGVFGRVGFLVGFVGALGLGFCPASTVGSCSTSTSRVQCFYWWGVFGLGVSSRVGVAVFLLYAGILRELVSCCPGFIFTCACFLLMGFWFWGLASQVLPFSTSTLYR